MADGVLLIGVGGLGNAVVMALANMGIPRLGLVDDDSIALSNLHRQILFQTADIGKSKVTTVRERAKALQEDWHIETYSCRLDTAETIAQLATDYRVVVDGSDNFTTRFAANDAAVSTGFPLVHGATIGTRGQLMTIAPGGHPCLRCLFGGPPTNTEATCRNEGVFGPLVGEVGWLMAMEAVKWIHGTGQPLFGQLLTIDALQAKRRTLSLRTNPDCSVCHNKTALMPQEPQP